MSLLVTAALLAPCALPTPALPNPGGIAGRDGVKLRIEAGDFDRRWTPATLKLDANSGLREGVHLAQAEGGSSFLVQVRADGESLRLETVIPALAKRTAVEFRLTAVRSPMPGYEWLPAQPGPEGPRSMDLLFGERRVLRYMHTPYDPADVEHTKKPFHHVFAPDGSRLLTKGAGGLYSHHRGIFFGYNKCEVGGKSHDIWHAAKGERSEHREVLAEWTGPVSGGHRVRIDWCDGEGQAFATEERSLRVWSQGEGALLVEFQTRLRPTRGPVKLHGDRQHAGVQFRAAQEVAENQKQTRYLRPGKWSALDPAAQINDDAHRGLPWNSLRFALGGEPYSVTYLSHEDNPDGAEFSERLYGRFGEYFPWELSDDRPLEVRYRWWIREGHDAGADELEARWRDLSHPPALRLVPGSSRR